MLLLEGLLCANNLFCQPNPLVAACGASVLFDLCRASDNGWDRLQEDDLLYRYHTGTSTILYTECIMVARGGDKFPKK